MGAEMGAAFLNIGRVDFMVFELQKLRFMLIFSTFFYLELQFTTEGSRPHFRPHFLSVSSLKKALPNLSIAQTIMFKRFELHTLASKEEQCAEIHENQPPQRFQTTPKII